MENNLLVDPEAGISIRLRRLKDSRGADFHIGKLQFPGWLDFNQGILFKAYVNRKNEVLRIIVPSEIDWQYSDDFYSLTQPETRFLPGRIHIDLRPEREYGRLVYVGEGISPGVIMPMHKGIFIALFLTGKEEIQISRYRPKPNSLRLANAG